MRTAACGSVAVVMSGICLVAGNDAFAQAPDSIVIESAIARSSSLIACDFDAVWAVSDGTMFRIDPADNSVVDIEIPTNDIAASLVDFDRFRGIAVGEGAIWLPDTATSTIHKIDPLTNSVSLSVATDIFGSRGSIGVGEGAIWVLTFDSRNKTLTRYNAQSGAEEAKIALPRVGSGVAVAGGSIWVTADDVGEVYRIDPETNSVVGTVPIMAPTHIVEAGDDAVWVSLEIDGLVQKIDTESGTVAATIDISVRDSVSDGVITTGDGFVWAMSRFTVISQIDPATNAVNGVYGPPQGTPMGRRLCYASGALWITGPATFRALLPR